MQVKSLALIGSGPLAQENACINAALSQWSAHSPQKIRRTTLQDILNDDSILDHCLVAWLVVQENALSSSDFLEVQGLLQDRHMPAMVSDCGARFKPGESFDHGITAAPLEAGPTVLAALLGALWNHGQSLEDIHAELQLLQHQQGGLCGQIDKIDEELRLAAQLQREFLPSKLPSAGPVQCKVLFRPAGYVSGDVYDVFQLDDHHLGIFLADAVGHGVPAALFTMYIKSVLRGGQLQYRAGHEPRIVPPHELLALLNQEMIEQPVGKMRFASACYGVLDCETLQLHLARAGHPFPLVIRADGSGQFLESEGSLLGVFADRPFPTTTFQLQPGDQLLVYSDGFEEVLQSRVGRITQPQANELASEFRKLSAAGADQALEELAHQLDQTVGSLNQRDDLTVLCIEVCGEPIHELALTSSKDSC